MAKTNRNDRRIRQVLPSSRIIPRIELALPLQEELTEIANAAYARHRGKVDQEEAIDVIMAPVRAADAIAWFVSDKHFEQKIPDFRKAVDVKNKKSIPAAVASLLNILPGDEDPPFAQLRSLYCYDDPQSNGLRSDDLPEEIAEKERKENRWDAQLSAREIRAALEKWIELFSELKTQTGLGRTLIATQMAFVSKLAFYWQDELKLPLGQSRGKENTRTGQHGYFAQFVMKAAEGIPAEYRHGSNSWDHAIREICSGKT